MPDNGRRTKAMMVQGGHDSESNTKKGKKKKRTSTNIESEKAHTPYKLDDLQQPHLDTLLLRVDLIRDTRQYNLDFRSNTLVMIGA